MNQPPQSPQENFDYGDSSWPLYSMYCKVAQEDDNKITERCQKDTDGTLVFVSLRVNSGLTVQVNCRVQTGLFAATVGTLLTISIPDLKPNSQDISAFYLENIFQLLASPNASDAMIPSPLTKAPMFSPPRYAVWVNSLWFLSLAISLSGAIVATLGQQWAHRYITITQHPRYTPDQRARIRAIFAEYALGRYCIWGAGLTPLYLHVSFFLFLAGGLIYLFNLNHVTFSAVVLWVFVAMVGYAASTVDGILMPENLFYTPFSPSALRECLRVSEMVFRLCNYIKPLRNLCKGASERCHALRTRYGSGFVEGKWTQIEEKASERSERSSEIDGMIIERTLLAMDDDEALGKFFDAIPGFCKSQLNQDTHHFPAQGKIGQALYGFLDRTLSSDSIPESVKSERLITSLNAAHAVLGPEAPSQYILEPFWYDVPQSVEMGHALTRWCTVKIGLSNIAEPLRRIVANILATVEQRDDRWLALAGDVFGSPEGALRDIVAHGRDSVLLFILIHTTRQSILSQSKTPWVLWTRPSFNIRDTLPGLQDDFCALWNEIVTRARRNEHDGPVCIDILRMIHHSYTALHQDRDAARVTFPHSAEGHADILSELLSYPLCNIDSHRSASAIHMHITAHLTTPLLPTPDRSPDASPQPAPLDGLALDLHVNSHHTWEQREYIRETSFAQGGDLERMRGNGDTNPTISSDKKRKRCRTI